MATVSGPEPTFRIPTYYITMYGIVVALLNQIGYWSHFSINILEHATIWDVAKFSVLPLATSSAVILGMLNTGSVIAEFTDPKRTSTGWRVGGAITMIFVSLTSAFLDHPVSTPTSVAIGGSVLLTGMLQWIGFDPFARVVPGKKVRDVCLFLVIFLPLMSLALGMQRALRIEHGRAGELAKLPQEILSVHGMSQADRLIYLGATDDYTFLLVAYSGDVMILRADAVSGVRLSAVQPPTKTNAL